MIRLGFNDPCRGNGADESINNHQTQPRRKNDYKHRRMLENFTANMFDT